MTDEQKCPTCGNPLNVDVLSGETRPCTTCGSVRALPGEKPQPDPEHQRRIIKSKGFEIALVVVIIIVGTLYVALFANRETSDGTAGSVNLSSVAESHGFKHVEDATIFGRTFSTYRRDEGILENELDLISASGSESIEAILMVVSHPAGKPFPPDDKAEAAIQDALTSMAQMGEALLPASGTALKKAISTMSTGRTGVAHNRGVAQTSDGWKITYVNYREIADTEESIPLLLLFYQRLSVASDPEMTEFNHALYDAINSASNLKSNLAASGGGV